MDDFTLSELNESKRDTMARLITMLSPFVIEGFAHILKESLKLCKNTHEPEKYLMTFQNLVSRIPKWNNAMIESECKRICAKSGCSHLEDLLTCVHVIQLKIMTTARAGQKQKQVDISIPKLAPFIHTVYTNVARKFHKKAFLFQVGISPLQIQKNNHTIETIVQECILHTIRENIPIKDIMGVYLNESTEENVVDSVTEEITIEPLADEPEPEPEPEPEKKSASPTKAAATKEFASISPVAPITISKSPDTVGIQFDSVGSARDEYGNEESVSISNSPAPISPSASQAAFSETGSDVGSDDGFDRIVISSDAPSCQVEIDDYID